MAFSMLKIRRPLGHLIFNMGIAIPGKTVFLIETAPWCQPLKTERKRAWKYVNRYRYSIIDNPYIYIKVLAPVQRFFSAQLHPPFMYCTIWHPSSTWVNVFCIRHWICLWRLFGSIATHRRCRVLASSISSKVRIYCYRFLMVVFFHSFLL